MSRYAILNTVDWEGCRELVVGELADPQLTERLTGCAWLFHVADGVDSALDAARLAVRDYFESDEGRHLARREALEPLRWEDAVAWVPDESWAKHGLVPIRYPEFERIILDAGEDLRESFGEPGEPR